MTRIGLALAAPRWALALADEPDHPGRAGSDLVRLLAVVFVAVHTRELVASAWLGAAIDPLLGGRTLFGVLAKAVTTPLAFLLVAALLTWLAAGSRRSLGRDFDVACVAVIPLVVVELAATLVVRGLGLEVAPAVSWGIASAGYAWTGGLVMLGIAQARRRRRARAPVGSDVVANLPEGVRRGAPRTGVVVAALVLALLAVNVTWVLRHLDWLRPMSAGDPVPAYALPRIEEDGALGAVIRSEDLADKVVVLDFWATWCKPCRQALPSLSALAARHDGQVVVLSINLDDAGEAWDLFAAEHYRTTLVADEDGETAERFGVGPIPHMVVVDRGVVRLVARGGNLQGVIQMAEQLAQP